MPKKRDSRLTIERRIEKRGKRIEKRTKWILGLVIAIALFLALFLALFYTQNYLGERMLTGKAGAEAPIGNKAPPANTGVEGGGDPISEAAENSEINAESASDYVFEVASELTTFTSISEATDIIDDIDSSLEKANDALNKINAALEDNVGSRYYELKKNKIVAIIEEIERTKKNVEDFIVAKEREKALIVKRLDNRIKAKIDLKDDIKDKLSTIKKKEPLEQGEITFSRTTTQGLATATREGDSSRPIEWTIEVGEISIPEGASGESIKLILPEKTNKRSIRFTKTGSASFQYIDRTSFLDKILRRGSEKAEISISNPKERETYEIRYETDSATFRTEKTSEKIRLTVNSDTPYQDIYIEFPVPEDFPKISSAYRVEGNVNFKVTEDENGLAKFELIMPSLSEEIIEIIVIIDAEHLNSNRGHISNIYETVFQLDDVWSEIIPSEDYVRVTFEQELTEENDITVYPRTISGDPIIEVYDVDSNDLLAVFWNLEEYEYNKIYLTELESPQDVFDLRVLNGDLQFDHIIDPSTCNNNVPDQECPEGCDAENDLDCQYYQDPEQPLECNDDIDNDGDGFIDWNGYIPPEIESQGNLIPADPGCENQVDNSEETQCQDNRDNDGDGLTDEEDPGCWTEYDPSFPEDVYNPHDDDESDGTSLCQDGIDNDEDDLIDLADADCENPQDYTESGTRGQGQEENDSDGDGVSDGEDNCPDNYNPDQEDSDDDGIGDVCDPTPLGERGDELNEDRGDRILENQNKKDSIIYKINDGLNNFGENSYADITGKTGDGIEFTLNGIKHTGTIQNIDIDAQTTTISFSSSHTQTITFLVGQPKPVYLEGGIITILVNDIRKIDNIPIALITVVSLPEKIREEVPEENPEVFLTPIIDNIVSDDSNRARVTATQQQRNTALLLILSVLVILTIIYVVFNKIYNVKNSKN